MAKPRIIRICIVISVLLVALSALLYTLDPARFTFTALLRTDSLAFVSIISGRIYLQRTRA